MPEIRIDPDLCKRDGFCVMACPVEIFQQKEKGALPELDRVGMCIDCGHCVAVCPSGALSHDRYPEGTVHPVSTEDLPSYEQVLALVRARRSKRRFKDKPVERADIERVLEAARFAPSGHNAQPVHFVVVQDKNALHKIGTLTADGLQKMMKPFKSPVSRAVMRLMMGREKVDQLAKLAPEMDGLAELFRSGKDLILNDAPALIVFHADSGGATPSIDANLALQNASLAAEAAGLGCFYGGFVLFACSRGRAIQDFLSLPKEHHVYGVLALGYPKLKYGNWPERKPLRVKWM
jgi:nitroreductase/NAD-dependent dihydropyrimidine dehydrogenase PreA subunit